MRHALEKSREFTPSACLTLLSRDEREAGWAHGGSAGSQVGGKKYVLVQTKYVPLPASFRGKTAVFAETSMAARSNGSTAFSGDVCLRQESILKVGLQFFRFGMESRVCDKFGTGTETSTGCLLKIPALALVLAAGLPFLVSVFLFFFGFGIFQNVDH